VGEAVALGERLVVIAGERFLADTVAAVLVGLATVKSLLPSLPAIDATATTATMMAPMPAMIHHLLSANGEVVTGPVWSVAACDWHLPQASRQSGSQGERERPRPTLNCPGGRVRRQAPCGAEVVNRLSDHERDRRLRLACRQPIGNSLVQGGDEEVDLALAVRAEITEHVPQPSRVLIRSRTLLTYEIMEDLSWRFAHH